MATQLTPTMLVNLPLLVLAASLAGYGTIRYVRGDRRQILLAFIVLVTAAGLWQVANLLRYGITAPTTKLVVINVINAVVIPLYGYSILWFALTYADASQRLIRAVLGILVVTVLVLIVAVTLDPEFLYAADGVVSQGPATLLNVTFEEWVGLDRTPKPTFLVYQLYSYVVSLCSAVVLVRYTIRFRSSTPTGQTVALSVGVLTPPVVNSLVFVGVFPVEWNPTDVAISVLLVGLAVAVFRYRALDIRDVGRQQFVEGMTDPLVFVDDDGRVIFSNPTARQTFDVGSGWTRMKTTEFFGSHAERILASNGGTQDSTIELDDRYFDVNSTTIQTPTGETGGRAIAFREVTELKETNRRLDQFAAMVSHDLRTPLNHATYQINRLERERSDDTTQAVRESLEQMETITDGMLRLARAGEDVDTTDECSVAELAEEVWETLQADGAELDSCAGDTTIEADQVRLYQLFENLFRNALEHTESPRTVRVGTLPESDELVDGHDRVGFFIEDDGSGIPETDRDAIFEHGYTTSDDGTGYGLSVVRQIVDAHGWEIHVTDGTDGGARFEITGVGAD
jgi:signal transduction histidine kinase